MNHKTSTASKADLTRQRILDAAAAIVVDKGVQFLTLDLVAARAAVSKGGLLYHFKSKDQLIEDLLGHTFDLFEGSVEKWADRDARPGAWLRGYIRASFPTEGEQHINAAATAVALIAALGQLPSLRDIYADHAARWHEKLRGDGVDLDLAMVVRMAVDGLWMSEGMKLSNLDAAQRQRIVQRLLQLTEQA
ncbi:TetR/AcrR family transcriptional regulator [Massilia phosphatilytica]|nr:TetR/AcrR family transcriptional regulator [Massilia phosphatilytica]